MGKIGNRADEMCPDHRMFSHQCPLKTGFGLVIFIPLTRIMFLGSRNGLIIKMVPVINGEIGWEGGGVDFDNNTDCLVERCK